MQDKLTEKEQLLLDSVRKNPYISQQELAECLGLSRPSIANMISGLMKKGHILGRAYVLQEERPVICIGGANIDRKFHLKEKGKLGTSNPAYASQNAGGVARNIAENLGRLGLPVSLISASGTDKEWSLIEESSALYMNLDQVLHVPEKSTGSYSAVLDVDGELIVAMADMEIYESITPDFLMKLEGSLIRAKCIVVDLNCPQETIQYLCKLGLSQNVPVILIPVSAPKMSRLPRDLRGVTWLITNRDESETFFEMTMDDHKQWKLAVDKWLELGVTNVVITNGKQGSMLGNKEEGIFHVPAIETSNIIDVTGAGDAFSSAVIYTWLEGNSLRECVRAGSVNAQKTLQSAYTVRQDLSALQLQQDMEE